MRQRDYINATDEYGNTQRMLYEIKKYDKPSRIKGLYGGKIVKLLLTTEDTNAVIALYRNGIWETYPFDDSGSMKAINYIVDHFN